VITLIGHVNAPARASTRRAIVDAMRGLVVEPYEGLPRNEGVGGNPIVEALPPGPYHFDAAPYTITPAVGWYRMNSQLPPSDATRNNRWLIAPYAAAILTIEHAPIPAGAVFDPARFVAGVRSALTPLPGTMRPDETLRAAAGEGTLITYETLTLGHRYRNLMWAYVTPSMGYTVEGIVPLERPEQHEAAVRAMIQSFTVDAP
jgi:hypothetical protein